MIGKSYPQSFIKQKFTPTNWQWTDCPNYRAQRTWENYKQNREEVLGKLRRRITGATGNPETHTDVFTGFRNSEKERAKSTHGHLTDTEAERGCEIIGAWIEDWTTARRGERVLPLPEFTETMTYEFSAYETKLVQSFKFHTKKNKMRTLEKQCRN